MTKLADNQSLIRSLVVLKLSKKSLNGQSTSAVHQVRKEAFASLNQTGFPAAKHEEYKFTNLTKALEKNIDFGASERKASLSTEEIESVKIAGLQAYTLVFLNGHYSAELSDDVSEAGFEH